MIIQAKFPLKTDLFGRTSVFSEYQDLKSIFLSFFSRYVPATMLYIQKECRTLVPYSEINIVENLISIFECMVGLDSRNQTIRELCEPEPLEILFAFACIWAFGACLGCVNGVDYKRSFSAWWKSRWTKIKFPVKGTVFDYNINLTAKSMVPWITATSNDHLTKGYGGRIYFITPEITALRSIMEMLLGKQASCILVGHAGCGRSSILNIVSKSISSTFQILPLAFNYLTDSAILQKKIEDNLEKKVYYDFYVSFLPLSSKCLQLFSGWKYVWPMSAPQAISNY